MTNTEGQQPDGDAPKAAQQGDKAVLPALAAMAAFKPNATLNNHDFGPFPLRQVAPDSVKYLVESRHFSVRDLKYIDDLLGQHGAPGDAEATYGRFLDVAEKEPWLVNSIELLVALKRLNRPLSKMRFHRFKKVVRKLPIFKLGLSANEHLRERLPELTEQPPLEPDIAVAAFCEYAVQYFDSKSKDIEFPELLNQAKRAIRAHIPDSTNAPGSDQDLNSERTEEDWRGRARSIIASKSDTENSARDLVSRTALAIRESAEHLSEESDPDDFALVSDLASAGKRAAERSAASKTVTMLFDRLSKAGIAVASENWRQLLHDALPELESAGFLNGILSAAKENQSLEGSLDELRRNITEATQSGDFALVGALSSDAATVSAALEKSVSSEREKLVAIRDKVFTRETRDTAGSGGEARAGERQASSGRAAQDVLQQEDSRKESNEPDSGETEDSSSPNPESVPADSALGQSDDALPAKGTVAAAKCDEANSRKVATPNEISENEFTDSGGKSNRTTLVQEHAESGHKTSVCGKAATGTEIGAKERAKRVEDPSPEPVRFHVDPKTKIPVAAVLGELIRADRLGLAHDLGQVFYALEVKSPLRASVLCAAAASRGPHRNFGVDSPKFLEIVATATSESNLSDLESQLLLGALIPPSIINPQYQLRRNFPNLVQGKAGMALKELSETISKLPHDFPPSLSFLAQVESGEEVSRMDRLSDILREQCRALGGKTSRWKEVDAFLRDLVSPSGQVGRASGAIAGGAQSAPEIAVAALEFLQSGLQTGFSKFISSQGQFPNNAIRVRLRYLESHLKSVSGTLADWLSEHERETAGAGVATEVQANRIRSLVSQLGVARSRLGSISSDLRPGLEDAIAQWIGMQIERTERALSGTPSAKFETLDAALIVERDYLSLSARESLDSVSEDIDTHFDGFSKAASIKHVAAIQQAIEEGRFAVAASLAGRGEIAQYDQVLDEMGTFAESTQQRILALKTELSSVSRLDSRHQEDTNNTLNECEVALERLAGATGKDKEIEDFDDILRLQSKIKRLVSEITGQVRHEQVEQLDQYRNEKNSEAIDELMSRLPNLPVETAEARIAEFRDGHSSIVGTVSGSGICEKFVETFVPYASSNDWPKSEDAFLLEAARPDSPMFLKENRVSAGLEFLSLYRSISGSFSKGRPVPAAIQKFLKNALFTDPRILDLKEITSGCWSANLECRIATEGWFLPPEFGSGASQFRLLLIGTNVLAQNVLSSGLEGTPTILLFQGIANIARRQSFSSRLRRNRIPALLIDEAAVAFCATRNESRIQTLFECGIPYGRIEPYVTDTATVPKEMFFGREQEIRDVVSASARGCLVYGGRQLGKSALLTHVSKTHHDPRNGQLAIRSDIKNLGNSEEASEIWSYLRQGLVEHDVVGKSSYSSDDVCRDIRGWLGASRDRRVLFMFDEADNFLSSETRDGFPELVKLKNLMEDSDNRRFKVVFAGLHDVQRMVRQPNSPLAHFQEPVCVGPMNRTKDDKLAAHNLLAMPMRAAGFKFKSTESIERILAWANFYPSLVQEYAKGLLDMLNDGDPSLQDVVVDGFPLREIPDDLLFKFHGFGAIESRVREKFHWTLDLDPRYATIAYTLAWLMTEKGEKRKALVTGYDSRELLSEALAFWPKNFEKPTMQIFDVVLDELFSFGVLGRVNETSSNTGAWRYMLLNRQVAAMLGTESQIEDALLRISERESRVSYDEHFFRREVGSQSSERGSDALIRRCPLTDFQIKSLFRGKGEASIMRVVCGLEVLGLRSVGRSLKDIARERHVPGASSERVVVEVCDTGKAFRRHVDESPEFGSGQRLVVYYPKDCAAARDAMGLLDRMPNLMNHESVFVLVLDAADKDMRQLAISRGHETLFLSTCAIEMIRMHLHQAEKTHLDTTERCETILRVTGGIPDEVFKLVEAMAKSDNPDSVSRDWVAFIPDFDSILDNEQTEALAFIDGGDGIETDSLESIFDLAAVLPDLDAMGFVHNFVAGSSARWVMRSALGDLVALDLDKAPADGSLGLE